MSSVKVADDALVTMGALSFLYLKRNEAKAFTKGRIIRCDTTTLIEILDRKYLAMHAEINEALKKSKTLNSKLTTMKRTCNIYRYMDSIRIMAEELGIEIEEDMVDSNSKFIKAFGKM